MFSTPTLRTFNHQENKDTLTVRKPGVLNSARKPLGDRPKNEIKSLKMPLGNLKINNGGSKETIKTPLMKKASPSNNNNYSDCFGDICSFKEVKDSYEDILPKSQRFNKFDFLNMAHPPTPPPRIDINIDPMLLEIPQGNLFKIEEVSENLEKLPVDDVEFPDFNSFMDMPF